jgi:polyprenyl P-hydroxybenzoate/phenylacrylic acid decarboxylase-like protein
VTVSNQSLVLATPLGGPQEDELEVPVAEMLPIERAADAHRPPGSGQVSGKLLLRAGPSGRAWSPPPSRRPPSGPTVDGQRFDEEDEVTRRLIVGVSGSSAPQLGFTVLEALRDAEDVETHLVLSAGAVRSIEAEMGVSAQDFEELADVVHSPADLGAAISSGSFETIGMVVVPCSMRTLSAVATGHTADLLTRAADVCLKERRRLVLVTRETPLNLIHIRNMETVTLAGGTILPPVPAFYHRPETIDDLLRQTAGKVLDQFGIAHQLFTRWSGMGTPQDDGARDGTGHAAG